jgi:hypothetical protein
LGTALQASGLPGASTYGPGYFVGSMDEARIWNYARTATEITASINSQIVTGQTGLIGRWGLNEGSGAAVHSNAGAFVDGTVMGSGYSWITSAPFNLPFNPPDQPTVIAPLNGATGVSTSPTLTVNASDPMEAIWM